MEPLSGSALVSAGSGLVGSLLSGAGSKKAAKIQAASAERINQINNEFNAREAALSRDWQTSERDAQNQWNLDQWNRENEYNTPEAQRQRMEAAGFNPYNMNIETGSASSKSSGAAPGAATATASQYPNVNQIPSMSSALGSGLSDAVSNYFRTASLTSQTTAQNLQNELTEQFGSMRTRAEIANMLSGQYEWLSPVYQKGRQAAAPNLLGIDLGKKTQEYQGLMMNNAYTATRALLTGLEAKSQVTLNKYLDQNQQLDLMLKSGELFNKQLIGSLTYHQIGKTIAETIETYARANGIKLDNRIKRETANDFIRAMKEEYKSNAAYYRSFKSIAGSVATARGMTDIEESNMARISRQMQEIMSGRESDSWENNRWYRNIMNAWQRTVGPILGGAVGGIGAAAMRRGSRPAAVRGFMK